MSKVSVIIPLYNQKEFVRQSIESILSQTYPNIEILVVNDGSTDNPQEVLRKYEENIIIINQENKGLSAARNAGLKECSGEYIQFLDADDFLHNDKIKLQLESMQAVDSVVSYCEVAQYIEYTNQVYLNYIGEIEDMFRYLYNVWYSYPLPIHALLFKKEIFSKLGLFEEQLKASEDRYFLSRVAVSGIKFSYFPFIGGFRRIHNNNMGMRKLHIMSNLIKYYKKINNEVGDKYFFDNFGYDGYSLMCANLTYMYATYIISGVCLQMLKEIRRIFKRERIKFNVKASPFKARKMGVGVTLIISYLKRWVRKIIEIELISLNLRK
jgi:glycosyltransferase involved in cell wall biosynthesis